MNSTEHINDPIFAIGDIHGRYDLLLDLMDRIEKAAVHNDKYRVIFLGDYVDRGPQSKEVIEYLMAGPADGRVKWITLRGNHEELMLQAARERRPGEVMMWFTNGGGATIDSYGGEFSNIPESHLEWIESLDYAVSTSKYAFVHAGLMPGFDLHEQEAETCIWIREKFLRSKYDWGRYIIHGHTPFWEGKPEAEKVEICENRCNLDTGAVWTGVLTAAILDDSIGGRPLGFIQTEEQC